MPITDVLGQRTFATAEHCGALRVGFVLSLDNYKSFRVSGGDRRRVFILGGVVEN
jgi:hypothetical protein